MQPSTKPAAMTVPFRQIRANYDSETITVYQAYSAEIAEAAVAHQKLHASPLFKPSRMTWIKPSWAWMLYRAGYSYKDRGQERILALKIKHEHFIELLEHGELAHQKLTSASATPTQANQDQDNRQTPKHNKSESEHSGEKPQVRVQWDPERTVRLEKLPYRSIQIGIPAALSPRWTETMIVSIEDVTEKARELKRVLDDQEDITDGELVTMELIPLERVFEVPEHVQTLLEMS